MIVEPAEYTNYNTTQVSSLSGKLTSQNVASIYDQLRQAGLSTSVWLREFALLKCACSRKYESYV